MPGVAKHPKLQLDGTAPNITIQLTDAAGTVLLESPGVFATAAAAQAVVRSIEDAASYALPQPSPLG